MKALLEVAVADGSLDVDVVHSKMESAVDDGLGMETVSEDFLEAKAGEVDIESVRSNIKAVLEGVVDGIHDGEWRTVTRMEEDGELNLQDVKELDVSMAYLKPEENLDNFRERALGAAEADEEEEEAPLSEAAEEEEEAYDESDFDVEDDDDRQDAEETSVLGEEANDLYSSDAQSRAVDWSEPSSAIVEAPDSLPAVEPSEPSLGAVVIEFPSKESSEENLTAAKRVSYGYLVASEHGQRPEGSGTDASATAVKPCEPMFARQFPGFHQCNAQCCHNVLEGSVNIDATPLVPCPVRLPPLGQETTLKKRQLPNHNGRFYVRHDNAQARLPQLCRPFAEQLRDRHNQRQLAQTVPTPVAYFRQDLRCAAGQGQKAIKQHPPTGAEVISRNEHSTNLLRIRPHLSRERARQLQFAYITGDLATARTPRRTQWQT